MLYMAFLKHRKIVKITLLWISSLSVLCSGVVSPALPKIAEAFHNIEDIKFKVKMMVVLPNLFIGFSAPFFGYIATKISKKLILIFALILYAISGTAGFYLEDIQNIMYSRIMLGVSISALMTVATSTIAEYFVEEQERNTVIAFQTTMLSISSIIYGQLGGFIADINWKYIFLLYGNSILILPFVIFFLSKRENRTLNIQENQEQRRDSDKLRVSAQNVYGILLVCISNWLIMIMFYTVRLQLPFVIKTLFPNGTSTATAFVFNFEVLLAAIISAKYKRFKKNRDFAVITSMSFLFIASSFLLIALSKTYLSLIISMIIYGTGMGFVMPNSTLWIISLIKSKDKSFFLGIFTMSTYMGKFLSPIILEPIIKTLGIQKAFIIEGIFCVFIAILSIYINDYFKRVNLIKFKERIRIRRIHFRKYK